MRFVTVHTRCQISHECALLFNPDVQFTDINCFCHNIFLLTLILKFLTFSQFDRKSSDFTGLSVHLRD